LVVTLSPSRQGGDNVVVGVRVSSPTLIGRGQELDRVAAALAEARDGHPAFFLVSGEAGVGKTRFLHEIADRARAAGASVLDGGCIEVGTEGLPFGPLIEALRGLSSELPAAELDELLGSGRNELARLMPQLQLDADDTPGTASPDGQAQGRLFEHVLLLFERLAARAPLIVVTEDVHWADRSTLDLLSFLGRNLRHGSIALFVSYRTDELHLRHPLVPFLAEQERNGRAERIELRRFDRTELTAQVTAILGAQPDPKLLERIAARSQGNAFYAEELLGVSARMVEAVSDRATYRGFVSIGVIEAVVHTWLPALLGQLRRQFPNVRVEIHSYITADLHEELLNGNVDVAFGVEPLASPAIQNDPICAFRMGWITAPPAPASGSAARPILEREPHGLEQAVHERLGSHRVGS
jgi:hypothetical protein